MIVPLSALTGEGFERLLERIGATADRRTRSFTSSCCRPRDGQRIAWLHAHGEVIDEARRVRATMARCGA